MNEPLKVTKLGCMPRQAAERIRENWNRVKDQVARAAEVSGRSAEMVRIVGVTKYVDAEITGWLVDAGCRDLGENRPQTLMQKAQWFASQPPRQDANIRWHQIGHLQRNKVRRLLEFSPLVHSIDSERLLVEIHTEAQSQSRTIDVLIEINVSGESAKTGLSPGELHGVVQQHGIRSSSDSALPGGARIIGLMAMAGLATDVEQVRRQFADLREMRENLQRQTGMDFPELSMGMSGDYEAAIAEGATMVRIGSSLFEGVLA